MEADTQTFGARLAIFHLGGVEPRLVSLVVRAPLQKLTGRADQFTRAPEVEALSLSAVLKVTGVEWDVGFYSASP